MEHAIKIFPVFSIEVDGFIETLEKTEERVREVRKGDVMTIEVKFNILNMKEKEERGYIHSNTYPYIKKDNFTIIITNHDGSRIFNFERVFFRFKTNTFTMQWRPQDAMDLHLIIYVKSDSYKGLDQKAELKFKILPELKREEKTEFVYNDQDLVEINKKTILG